MSRLFNKTYYDDYTKHALCQYLIAGGERPQRFRSWAEQDDWESAEKAYLELSPDDQEIIRKLYIEHEPAVEVAAEYEKSVYGISVLKSKLSTAVAKNRGLNIS